MNHTQLRRLPPLATLIAGLLVAAGTALPAAERDDSAAEKLGWHLATKCYTFIKLSLSETLDISKQLGLRYIELNPTQLFSKERPEKTNQDSSPELREAIKKRLAELGITALGFGVVKLDKDEAGDRKIFQFAKDLGIQVIVSEPPGDAFGLLDKLTTEYGIKVAMHNHPEPSPYWKPEIVLATIMGHNALIGSCADVGHWARSGLKPVDCLHLLEGHIISLHFKDTNKVGKGARDVPFGTGQADVKGMLTELKRQGFKGLFSLEYESGASGDQLIGELKQSIAFFDDTAKELAR
jgi:sugar phosphate isomerase/epimerase